MERTWLESRHVGSSGRVRAIGFRCREAVLFRHIVDAALSIVLSMVKPTISDPELDGLVEQDHGEESAE